MERVKNLIENNESFAIFAHISPDGDALGSALGLKLALISLGKSADVYCDDKVEDKFNFLPGFSDIKDGDLECKYDCLIAVDCGDKGRVGKYGKYFDNYKNSLLIDHHINSERFAKVYYLNDKSASTAQIVLKIIKENNVTLTTEICECLYTGISTDTGNFSHSNTTKEVFTAATELAEFVDVAKINNLLYKSMEKAKIKLLGRTLGGIRFYEDSTIAILTVTQKDLQECMAEKEHTAGIVDYAIGINGVDVGVLMYENSQNSFKISLRSKEMNVRNIASSFGGGGHILASGCRIDGFYEDVIDKILRGIELER